MRSKPLRAVTIAAIHWWCVDGGLVLAAACDLRVAAEDAPFSIPEIDLGIPLAWGGESAAPGRPGLSILKTRSLGADDRLLAAIMGHGDPRSVEKYAKVQGTAIRSALAKLEKQSD
ncbi:MAG TPA: enoyl-CoA hydratase-related protein [Myxococcota bacterium]|nr:enoyl-CoA hydratase-related protein [Myxococcota bacterium]